MTRETPTAMLRAAEEHEAAARWGDRVAADYTSSGRRLDAIRERTKNAISRARAGHLRAMAARVTQ